MEIVYVRVRTKTWCVFVAIVRFSLARELEFVDAVPHGLSISENFKSGKVSEFCAVSVLLKCSLFCQNVVYYIASSGSFAII